MNAFFIGIGGMGMSGIAKILFERGYKVAGSDRNLEGDYCKALINLGIKIYPQDGSGPEKFIQAFSLDKSDIVVVKSTAVEDQVADVVTSVKLGLKQIMRSDLLADLFNAKKGIAIGGTAGKTTTTGLLAWIFKYCKKDPSCAVGGIINGLDTNAFDGSGENFIIEADESDGSIVKYKPSIAILTNISRDHKPLEELKDLFHTFLSNTSQTRLVCYENQHVMDLAQTLDLPVVTYGFNENSDYRATKCLTSSTHSEFELMGTKFLVNLPGEHNILNSLCAVVASLKCGIPIEDIAKAVKNFHGMKRRFETVGTSAGVTVIDDFAHNPMEIEASIRTARSISNRRFIVYQPHGYGPTSFTKDDLVHVLGSLRSDEYLYLDDIYYAGGTVNKSITSQELVSQINQRFKNVHYLGSKEAIIDNIISNATHGDLVLVMGARDINKICRPILNGLNKKKAQTDNQLGAKASF